MKDFFKASLLACIISAASVPTAASILFSPSVIEVVPGQTGIAVLATFTNDDPVNTEFLNGDNINLTDPPFVVNDEFFANAPILIAPSDNSGPVELFQFEVSPGAAPGQYTGTYDLFGGLGVANQSNFDPLDTQTFTIQVDGVPEPSTLLLVVGSLIGLGRLRYSSRSDKRPV